MLLGACTPDASSPPPTRAVIISPTPLPAETAPIPSRPATPTTTVYPPIERTIALDTPVEGVYIPGQVRELYMFDNDRPRRISLRLEARDEIGALHLQAQVFWPGGQIVPQVTSVNDQRAVYGEWDLAEPGRYIIQVFGPETQARAFTLLIGSHPLPISQDYSITYDQSRSGEIAVRGQRDMWEFQGRAGDQVRIILIAPGGDGILALRDADGDLLAQADDHPRLGQNPVIEITLPADGTYTITAGMYDNESVGVYRLSLERILEH